MKNKVRLAIVDDQHLFWKGLISLLHEFPEVDVSIEASSAKDLLAQLERKRADVLLMDIQMPEINGIRLAQMLGESHPELRILVLSMHNEESMILQLLEFGVRGFLLKESDISDVVDAIHSVMTNGYYFNDRVSMFMINELINNRKIQPNFKKVTLSEREIEIIRLICLEYTNKEIGEKLYISARTVDGHRENILRKTEARNVAGIVMYAIRNNIVF